MDFKILYYIQNLWPFSKLLGVDDLRVSDQILSKLSIPESTKRFVFAIQEPGSQSVIYLLAAQSLSERSAVDAEHLIREIKPDAVVAQVGNLDVNDIQLEENDPIPTSPFEVVWRSFVSKFRRERYENLAGNYVLKAIFGTSFHGHFLAAKGAAEEVGSSFLVLESPSVKSVVGNGNGNSSNGSDLGNKFLCLQPSSLVPGNFGSVVSSSSAVFCVRNDVQREMVRSLSSYMAASKAVHLNSSDDLEVQPRGDFKAPMFAQSVYLLLVDLHDIFMNLPSIGRALAYAQKLLYDVNRGEAVDARVLSEVHTFRIAVEGLRIALNNAGRVPMKKLWNPESDMYEFKDLSIDEKSHALLAQAIRSQAQRFKTVVAVVDAGSIGALRKYWNTEIPSEVKDVLDELVTDCESDGIVSEGVYKWRFITDKPVVAVGAGATAVLGASSLSKLVPLSTLTKVVTFKVPPLLKIILTQTQKAVAIAFGKTFGPAKLVVPGFTSSGAQTSSLLKAAASAEKIRAVTHSVIASAEKTSFSAMRTAFYQIMRNRHVQPIGLLPWCTFGCSIATCAGLLLYGDGIECAVESFPAAPSIASLGRGIQSLHQASQEVRRSSSSKVTAGECLLYRMIQPILVARQRTGT
ncbi:hypothetical protein RJ641_009394 [Dillenia turbinata]|uniref:Uncharacterized protein n=1 Tax=Dillenia turbinata TaxID=194707 RepID=A0AAN8Z956_9MAGN